MSLKKKVAIAILLALTLNQVTNGIQFIPIKPVPQSAFREVVLYEPSVVPTLSPAPTPTAKPTPKPRITPKPVVASSGHSASGTASFYCNKNSLRGPLSRCTRGYSGGYYAAIRKDLLYLRGKTIQVCVQGDCIPVKIIDCNCGTRANLIDLYSDAFTHFYSLSKGVFKVKIQW